MTVAEALPAVIALLEELHRRAPDVLLWRGPDVTGRDIDLLVLATAGDAVVATFRAAELVPGPGDPGHVVWRDPSGSLPPIDVLPAAEWPASHPPLDGLMARARREAAPLAVTSPEDRLLIFAAEAIAGRPLERIAAKVRALAFEPGVLARAEQVAGEEVALVALVADPSRLEQRARRGRLPYAAAAGIALRSPMARAALVSRVLARVGLRRQRRPLLVSVSGMDGAGKSMLAQDLCDHLLASGRVARVSWARLGAERRLLDFIGAPVKRMMGREVTVGDPVAAGGPTVTKSQDPRVAAGRRGVLAYAWIIVVAALHVYTCRRAAAARRAGLDVVCDRWRTDAVVDLRLRYGRHRVAEALLRRAIPRPAVEIVLTLDAATAHARKPGDQAPHVLERAERIYAEVAADLRATVIDALLPAAEVRRLALQRIDDILSAA